MKPNIDNLEDSSELNDKQIIKNFYGLLSRNKLLIISTSSLFFVIFCFIAVFKQRIWKGQFEIVLKQEKESLSSSLLNSKILSSLDFSKEKSLKTEVGILESSSVLMPIFDFVKEQKKIKNPSFLKSNFAEWKKNSLNMYLKSNTSILKISYQDSDKEVIKPVLTKISEIYQRYSNERKQDEVASIKNYIEKQIKIYKKKSSVSVQRAQEYALDQDLTILSFNSLPKLSQTGKNIDIEKIRVNADNEIKKINMQINKINELDNQSLGQYIGLTIPAINKKELPTRLDSIDAQLSELRLNYKENNLEIVELKKQKEKYLNALKEKAIDLLKVKKMKAESTKKLAMRPKGVVIKYRELLREAARDEQTLVNLENQLTAVMLDKAKTALPYQLITEPTLLDKPVAPKRRRIALFGIIFGFLGGSLLAFFKEKKDDVFYGEENLERFLSTSIMDSIIFDTKTSNFDKLDILIKDLKIISGSNNIKFLKTSNIEGNQFEKFVDAINVDLALKINSFEEITASDKIFLITKLENLSSSELVKLRSRLLFLKKSLFGIILFKNK